MYNNVLITFDMYNNDFDKYVQYVIAQVGEGNHSKDEMKQDLLSRGLSNNDVDAIIEVAFTLGRETENKTRTEIPLSLIINLVFPIIMCILLWIAGVSIIKSSFFAMIIGGIIAFVRVNLLKKKF